MVMSGVNCYYEANDKAPVKFKQKQVSSSILPGSRCGGRSGRHFSYFIMVGQVLVVSTRAYIEMKSNHTLIFVTRFLQTVT